MTDATLPIPVTLLTGFLGAGKTTLLNQLLAQAGERIVVIENEFGPVSIDSELLIETRDELVEMTNGCLCCTIRGDLARHLHQLYRRRQAGELAFTRLVIETTGLADPSPIAQTFFSDDTLSSVYALDAVITVVDAVHAAGQLDQHAVARKQVGFADSLFLSKTANVDAATLGALQARLASINSQAPQHLACAGSVTPAQLFGLRGFHLDEALLQPATARHRLPLRPASTRSFSDDIAAVHLSHTGRLDRARISAFMNRLVAEHAEQLLRYKGILAIADEPRRLVFQGVHRITGFDYGRAWQPDETPHSDIVLIGQNLPADALQHAFTACVTHP